MIKISDKRNLCGDMGGTRGSAGESRGETLRGPDTSRDQQLHHIDEEGEIPVESDVGTTGIPCLGLRRRSSDSVRPCSLSS